MSDVRRFAALLLAVCLGGCASGQPASHAAPPLSYLGQTQIGFGAVCDGTVVGGLSGISYDPQRQIYYVISDDRSKKAPARFYTFRLSLSDNGIDDATCTGAYSLRDRSGAVFNSLDSDSHPPVVPPDPEGIAFDAGRQRLYWSSEGERITDRQPVLLDPWVRIAGLDGNFQGEFTLPANLKMSAQHTGPRRNLALEGLTLAPSGASLFAAKEDPGYQDGPLSDGDHQVLTRITKFDVATTAPTAQYAYPMEPPGRGVDRNGVSDLVALSDTTFLVLERSTAIPPVVRVYRAEIGPATDVSALPSMHGAALTPMSKSLAIDLSATRPLDNIEGITLGPRLPDGRQSVVLVSDDNFASTQITQFVLLAM